MVCFWQNLCCLLLVVQCAWSIVHPDYASRLNSPTNYPTKVSPLPAAVQETNIIMTREYSLQMNQTIKYGLPKCIQQLNQCRQIGIIGAGVAGLYSAILLAQSGHTVTIYEASDRAGGRILTYRDPQNPTVYMGELGAMRFPLDAHPYLNSLIRQRYKLNITEFQTSDDNAYIYINGILATVKQARENPDMFGFNTSQSEKGKTPDQLWNDAVQPILNTFSQQGWSSVKDQWDSYSIDSYLNKINMSRPAIDYMGLFANFETHLHLSILFAIRDQLVISDQTKLYSIQGGSDLLVQSMVAECQAIESNRCSIVYSTPVAEVHLFASGLVHLTTKNGTSKVFNSVIVATTATAAQLIDFNPRAEFSDKYRVMRQLQYDCATKVVLFFNVSWWYTQENISGGRSITDLPVRFIYYPTTSSDQTDSRAIIASYTWSQDSIVWQSLSDSDAIELALKQLIKIHPSSANMRDYFQGGKVKHWCNDPYSIGAWSLLIPFQETELLDKLQASISNVHFIGEHTSLVHAWVEGAIVSALRPALLISAQVETTFDVVIVGSGPISLTTAVFLSLKEPALRIVIVEQGTVINSDRGSGTFDQQQYRQMYDEVYIAELANVSFTLWRQLEQIANMSLGSILDTDDGYLFFSDFDASQSSVEGDLQSTKRICEERQMGCEYLNSTQLQARYPTFTFSRQHQGIFHKQSGYINVSMLMMALVRIIARNPNIIIREQEQFLSLKLANQTQIVTDRGVLRASRKVLFVPGPYAKHVSRLLNFDLNVTLWELPVYYFRLLPNATRLPTWFAWDGSDLQSVFSGFPITSSSDYIAVLPGFISNLSNSLIYPSQRATMIDPFITQKLIEWVSQHMAIHVNVSDYYVINETYLATFLPDNGVLLDYVPQTKNQVLMHAAGWGMKFVPVWGDILSEMILFNDDDTMKASSKYAKYMEYFSLSRPNRLIEDVTATSNEYDKR